VLRSYQMRLSSSVAVPNCTMRSPDKSSGSASPRFSRQRRIRAASSVDNSGVRSAYEKASLELVRFFVSLW
jgi:hypothetical protein